MKEVFTDALCTLLNHPTRCPHGLPIPMGSYDSVLTSRGMKFEFGNWQCPNCNTKGDRFTMLGILAMGGQRNDTTAPTYFLS